MESMNYTDNMISAAPQTPPAGHRSDRAKDTLVLETVTGPNPTIPPTMAPALKSHSRMSSMLIMLGIVLLGLFLNTFRTMEAIDLKSDESTYAIESVSLARVGMTRWNGGPFFVHPPLFFELEGLYYKLAGVGDGPLFTRLIGEGYTAGVPLMPADAQLTGDSVQNAIRLGRYLNALYGGILAAIVFLLGSALLNRKVGLLAAALFMLDPYVLWRNHFNYLEGLTTILGVLALYLYYKATQRTGSSARLRGFAIAGVVLGLALLTKELALLFVAALFVHWILFRRTRPAEIVLPLGIGFLMYMLFPLWAAINGEFQNWWDTRSWLLKRITGQIRDTGVATDRPGTSLLGTLGVNLPDYWPWFLLLGTAMLLAIAFLYLYFRRGLRDSAGEFLTACVIGTYGFFVIVRLVGGVINEHFFYYLMPTAALMPAYMVFAWPRLRAAMPGRTTTVSRQQAELGAPLRAGASLYGSTYDPEAPTVQMPITGGSRAGGRTMLVFLGILLALLAYDSIAWVARYGFSRDNSYISVDAELANTLPPGTAIVGRDLLDLYLLPKQAVYTFSYLNFIGRDADPANIRDRAIPYALLNDQSLQQRYGGANPLYYQWVYANASEVQKFNGRLYNTYLYRMDYSRPEQAFNADSIAAKRPVVASSVEDPRFFAPENAVDTRITTRWSSKVSETEWIYVDLGESKNISRVVLSWEDAFAQGYELQVSDDAQTWQTFYKTDKGAGGLETVQAKATGRYLRLLMTKRGTQYGYSLWEFSVYP